MNGDWVDATFEAIEVGETFGPIELVLDDHFMKSHAFAVDDYDSSLFSKENTPGPLAVPPAALVPGLLRLMNLKYNPNTEAGLHQKEEIWMGRAVAIGTHAVLTRRFVDKYTKRGKGYVVSEGEARTVDTDDVIVRHRSVEVARIPENIELGSGTASGGQERRVRAEWPDGAVPIAKLDDDSPVGTAVVGPTKVVHQAQMSVFSNIQEFWHSIHTDLAAAKRAGLQSTVAQGLMEALYLSEMGHRLYGDSWYSTGHLSLLFVAPVYPEEPLEARGLVIQREARDGGAWFELEVWMQKGDQTKTVVGWMSGIRAAVTSRKANPTEVRAGKRQ